MNKKIIDNGNIILTKANKGNTVMAINKNEYVTNIGR